MSELASAAGLSERDLELLLQLERRVQVQSDDMEGYAKQAGRHGRPTRVHPRFPAHLAF